MRKISQKIATALGINSEKGVTAIEYGLLATLIALAIVTAAALVGTNLSAQFTSIAGKV
jgi:pilus assembly protein Flp/PilA